MTAEHSAEEPMKGNVIGFDADANTGAISGHDGKRYDFATQDWHAPGTPRRGDVVDFTGDGARATQIYILEPQYVQPSFGQFYFSAKARISRKQYWLKGLLALYGIWLILYCIMLPFAISKNTVGTAVFGSLLAIYTLVIIWPGLAILIKRIHDRNKSGWLILIPMIPGVLLAIIWSVAIVGVISAAASGSQVATGVLVGAGVFTWIVWLISFGISIWFFIEFGCMRGTIGANAYGPDPVPRR